MSADVYYIRRSWGNQTTTDNRAVGPGDFDTFGMTAPVNAKLPGGGGYRVQGFADVKPAKFGLVDNYVTFADNFGGVSETYNGVDMTVSVRPRNGLTAQRGFSTGRSAQNTCALASQLAETLAIFGFFRQPASFCNQATPFLTQVKALASYTIPRVDVQVSAGFASLNLVKPGERYGDRINQMDIRAAKILRYGRTRTNISLDLFNIFNANPVLTYNQAVPPIFGGAPYLSPTSVLTARLAKLTVQFDW